MAAPRRTDDGFPARFRELVTDQGYSFNEIAALEILDENGDRIHLPSARSMAEWARGEHEPRLDIRFRNLCTYVFHKRPAYVLKGKRKREA